MMYTKPKFPLYKDNFTILFNFMHAVIHKIIHFTQFISKINSYCPPSLFSSVASSALSHSYLLLIPPCFLLPVWFLLPI